MEHLTTKGQQMFWNNKFSVEIFYKVLAVLLFPQNAIQWNRRKAFYVESEIFFCVEGSILAIKSGTTDLTPSGVKPSLAKAYQFAALGLGVVIVVLQVVSCVQICLFIVFVFQVQLPKTKAVCLFVYICIYVNIQYTCIYKTQNFLMLRRKYYLSCEIATFGFL